MLCNHGASHDECFYFENLLVETGMLMPAWTAHLYCGGHCSDVILGSVILPITTVTLCPLL
jgi:hypothetical protein